MCAAPTLRLMYGVSTPMATLVRPGVERVVHLLGEELRTAMSLLGTPKLADINSSHVCPATSAMTLTPFHSSKLIIKSGIFLGIVVPRGISKCVFHLEIRSTFLLPTVYNLPFPLRPAHVPSTGVRRPRQRKLPSQARHHSTWLGLGLIRNPNEQLTRGYSFWYGLCTPKEVSRLIYNPEKNVRVSKVDSRAPRDASFGAVTPSGPGGARRSLGSALFYC
eukprot:8527185-Pyramimonas_sp.AAC.3